VAVRSHRGEPAVSRPTLQTALAVGATLVAYVAAFRLVWTVSSLPAAWPTALVGGR
jgi:hypothetical protein